MTLAAADWEQLWAPYDPATYAAVLGQIDPQDHVLEIGAGDLRLACQMARRARRVIAIENNPEILERGKRQFAPLPGNLDILCADARSLDFPNTITLGVLLMRHCTHFSLYAERLRQAGCRRLITNARWRMNIETVRLDQPPVQYNSTPMGWYACRCGAVGFKPGPPEEWTAERDPIIHEVCACPECTPEQTGS